MYGGGYVLWIQRQYDSALLQYGARVSALEQKCGVLTSYMTAGVCDAHHDKNVILCLGNSITRHSVKETIEWYSDWGMAASRQDNDYVHQLERMLKENNPESTVAGLNIACWERDFSCNLDSLIGPCLKDVNTVVVRLGENVEDVDSFADAIDSLVSYVSETTDNIVITGCFWADAQKDKALFDVAFKHGLPFVPISWIDQLYDSRPEIGDTLYDVKGNPYTINKDFIISHPDDCGMEMIARAIYNSL